MTIGHRTARRAETVDGWAYEDQGNQALAIWCLMKGANLPDLDARIEEMERNHHPGAAELRARRDSALHAFLAGRLAEALGHIEFIHVAWKLAPFVFNAGKPRPLSPIRNAIRRELKKAPKLKNREVWATLAAKPPKGWHFHDDSAGKYIDGPKRPRDNMNYARFSEICLEERKKLMP